LGQVGNVVAYGIDVFDVHDFKLSNVDGLIFSWRFEATCAV
jgi:hypothetical protein